MWAIAYALLAAALWYSGSAAPVVTACSANVNLSPLGATVSVNSLAPQCLANPADTTASNTSWTAASTKYVSAPATNQFILNTLSSGYARDAEISTWTRQGYVYLRYDAAGDAIYFFHNGDQTNGYLEIGIVKGLSQTGSYPVGTYYPLYEKSQLVSLIGTSGSLCTCGYTSTATDGQYFTFGVQGVTIYAKYSAGGAAPTQFVSLKDFHKMSGGAVALASNGDGFRGDHNGNIVITSFGDQPLFSNFSKNILDPRDFGLQSIATTGSISSGGNTLTLGAGQNFHVGDYAIVETGQESGAGVRGTLGIGGDWPTLSYSNAVAMNADTSKPLEQFAWTQNDGTVYSWMGGSYTVTSYTYNSSTGEVILTMPGGVPPFGRQGCNVTVSGLNIAGLNGTFPTTEPSLNLTNIVAYNPGTGISGVPSGGGTLSMGWITCFGGSGYYTALAVPRALIARVNAIGGGSPPTTLTLQNPDGTSFSCLYGNGASGACASASGANVYFDNEVIMNSICNPLPGGYSPVEYPGLIISYPAGNYYFGGYTSCSFHPGWTIQGQGQGVTSLLSPNGTYGAGIFSQLSNGFAIQNLSLSGNVKGPNGFGIGWTPGTWQPNSFPSTFNADGTLTAVGFGGGVPESGSDTGLFQKTSSIGFNSGYGQLMHNLSVSNIFSDGANCAFTANCFADHITITNTDARQQYSQWAFEWSNVQGGGCSFCTYTGTTMNSAFSCFASAVGPVFDHITIINGSFGMNDCGIFTISNTTITTGFDAISPFWSIDNALLGVNSNTTGHASSAGFFTNGGGVINNVTITTDYVDGCTAGVANCDIPAGIVIDSANGNVMVSNVTLNSPNYSSPSGLFTPNVVLSQGGGTIVTNVKGCATTQGGMPTPINSMIGIASPATGGSVTGSTTALSSGIQVAAGNAASGNNTSCP